MTTSDAVDMTPICMAARASRIKAQVVEGAARDLHNVCRSRHALWGPVYFHGEVPPWLSPCPNLHKRVHWGTTYGIAVKGQAARHSCLSQHSRKNKEEICISIKRLSHRSQLAFVWYAQLYAINI